MDDDRLTPLDDDEIVADSEEENNGMDLLELGHENLVTPNATKLDEDQPPSKMSSVSSNALLAHDVPKPRPRPRPVAKGKDKSDYTSNTQAASYPDGEPHTLVSLAMPMPASNIADRAKTRPRKQRISDGREALPTYERQIFGDIIEISSSDDELAMAWSTSSGKRAKQKNKPKPVAKDKTTSQANSSAGRRAKSKKQSASCSGGTELPRHSLRRSAAVPQSPSHPGELESSSQFHLSQLPPSDPPPPSTAITVDYPPIETLPNFSTDLDAPSSPSSLFSIENSSLRKRKYIDELDPDDELAPPNFFASSTSSAPSIELLANHANSSSRATKKPRKKVNDAEKVGDQDFAETTKKNKGKGRKQKSKVEVVIRAKKGRRSIAAVRDDASKAAEDRAEDPVTRNSDEAASMCASSSASGLDKQDVASNHRGKKVQEIQSDRSAVLLDLQPSSTKKGKRKLVTSDDEEGEVQARELPNKSNTENAGGQSASKENMHPDSLERGEETNKEEKPHEFELKAHYSIAPKTKSTPMSELIRRVNSLPGSPFPSASPRGALRSLGVGTAYSPYLKSSRSLLSRIAPLHPNRRTPPPPPPPPPAPKKTKKQLEREEQWEEELVESVGGVAEWALLSDAERKELRRLKWDKEMSGWED